MERWGGEGMGEENGKGEEVGEGGRREGGVKVK